MVLNQKKYLKKKPNGGRDPPRPPPPPTVMAKVIDFYGPFPKHPFDI